MQTLEEIRAERQVNQELTEIVDALKVIAVTEFWNLEERRRMRSKKFLDAFGGFFEMIDFSTTEHPFAQDTTGQMTLILVTSDERFMGGLNKRVVDTALEYPGADKAEIVVIGTQGSDYLRSLKRQHTVLSEVTTSQDQFESALKLRDHVMEQGLRGEYGRLAIVYPRPVSFFVQAVETLPVLPCTELLAFERKRMSDQDSPLAQVEDVIIESNLHDLLEYMVRLWVTEKFLEVFEDSRQAELSAKSVRLEESHQTLQDAGKDLRHLFNRSRREKMDKGMRETFTAQIMRRRVSFSV